MTWTTNGFNGLDRYDDRAEFYRKQDEERREREHVERSARWIASKLSGHQYDSLAALQRSVVELVTEWQCEAPDEEMMGTIQRATVLLWLGHVDMDARYRRCVVRAEGGIKFLGAA